MKRLLLIICFILYCSMSALAQGIVVTGRLTYEKGGKPVAGADIYVYKTRGDGKDDFDQAVAAYEDFGDFIPTSHDSVFKSEDDGTFELVNVREKGSILVLTGDGRPAYAEISGHDEIFIKIEKSEIEELEAGGVTGKRKKKTKKGTKTIQKNGYYERTAFYRLNKDMLGDVRGVGKSNARLVAQAYIVTSDGTDTIHYFTPKVYVGDQFQKTQKHWRDDYLCAISDSLPKDLTDATDTIHIKAGYKFDDLATLYFCKANVWIEDYLGVYYYDTLTVFNTGRASRPFQFLEYSFDQYEIDRENKYYKKTPKKEKVPTPKNMKLKFVPNSAELNRKDQATMAALDSLKDELAEISRDPYSRLRELHFKGYSSPDGQYAKNDPLSKARTRNVFREIYNTIPSYDKDRIEECTDSGFVATWEDVAALMERDSLVTEARQIREIIAKNSGKMDAQWIAMTKLPFYKTTMAPYRDELRSVKCEYVTEVFRELKPHEILEKYNDESLGYKNGNKYLTLNEYWHLFELVKDEAELERLYIRAKRHAMNTEFTEWALPNNKLAIMYLRRNQADTTLLRPFIDEQYGANQEVITDPLTGRKAFVNDDAIVANQVQMLVLAGKYDRAEELSFLIRDKYPMLRAIVRCLGWFIDYDNPNEMETIDLIQKSSPRNQVQMNLYRAYQHENPDPDIDDSTTVVALNSMPQDDPITYYLRAQRLCLKYDNDEIDMQGKNYDRAVEDPYLEHPKDEFIPAATPEEIEALKAVIEGYNETIQGDLAMNMDPDPFTLAELSAAEAKLAAMMEGEAKVIPCSIKVDEAVYQYLRKCFKKDRKYIRIAQADEDINEAILKKVLKKLDEPDENN